MGLTKRLLMDLPGEDLPVGFSGTHSEHEIIEDILLARRAPGRCNSEQQDVCGNSNTLRSRPAADSDVHPDAHPEP